jgi:hypothetical protein
MSVYSGGKAGFKPIRPEAKGSDIIQAGIIKHLAEADLVLCDMSILNANVFYELGIRTALDKPICLISDDKLEKFPFDTAILNCLKYSSTLKSWEIQAHIDLLAEHIADAYEKAEGRNSMWKYFGVTTQITEFKPEATNLEDKVDMLTREVMALRADKTANSTTANKAPTPLAKALANSLPDNTKFAIFGTMYAQMQQEGSIDSDEIREIVGNALVEDHPHITANESALTSVTSSLIDDYFGKYLPAKEALAEMSQR